MGNSIGAGRAILNGLLCLALLGLAGLGAHQVAGRQWLVQKTFETGAEFQNVSGLEAGGRVQVQGMDAGVIEAIVPPDVPGGPVRVQMRLDARLKPLIRADARARIASQGVVGAKVVEIHPGSSEASVLPENGMIATEEPVELADLLAEARASLARVDAVATQAEAGLAEITAIASTIRQGEGTLGRLVQDDEAYERLIRMAGRGEKTLGDLGENLEALKHTWPISRYFNGRAYFDRDRVLYQPGASRQSRVFLTADLFEPGRAVLTTKGREVLDQSVPWFKERLDKNSEIVIAAFTDHPEQPDLAEVLTQEQADAVRRYLGETHKLNTINWFRSRKVAAVGFGTHLPEVPGQTQIVALPRQRIEVILFTPQA